MALATLRQYIADVMVHLTSVAAGTGETHKTMKQAAVRSCQQGGAHQDGRRGHPPGWPACCPARACWRCWGVAPACCCWGHLQLAGCPPRPPAHKRRLVPHHTPRCLHFQRCANFSPATPTAFETAMPLSCQHAPVGRYTPSHGTATTCLPSSKYAPVPSPQGSEMWQHARDGHNLTRLDIGRHAAHRTRKGEPGQASLGSAAAIQATPPLEHAASSQHA
jgi:hypothetical protein